MTKEGSQNHHLHRIFLFTLLVLGYMLYSLLFKLIGLIVRNERLHSYKLLSFLAFSSFVEAVFELPVPAFQDAFYHDLYACAEDLGLELSTTIVFGRCEEWMR